MIRLFAGFDSNEVAGYHTFCHSVITRSSQPVSITPICKSTFPWWARKNEVDHEGATEFSFSRFLIPYLCDYRGHAIFMDGADMLCLGDIAELWEMRSHNHSVQVVKHPGYQPKRVKMWDQENRAYPRKNWSSVMILNCEYHHAHKLTPEYVANAPGSDLHQLVWTSSERIGELPAEWNVLVEEQVIPDNPKVLHYSLGLPAIRDTEVSAIWHKEREAMNYVRGYE